jgi:hypothetical protein
MLPSRITAFSPPPTYSYWRSPRRSDGRKATLTELVRMSPIAKLRFWDYVLAFRVIIWTIAVRVGLTTLRFATVRSLIMDRARPITDRYTIEQIVWGVRAVSRYVPNATCLTQALVVQRFLITSGYRCRFRLGVAKDAVRGFEAHAWVECDERVVIGESVGESVTSRFTPIAAWDG